MDEMTGEGIGEVARSLPDSLGEAPLTIGVLGVSGTGKSSTINALFNANLAISHTGVCTKQIEETEMVLMAREGAAKDGRVNFVIVDTPGLGGGVSMDSVHIDRCRERLPDCDVILWVMAARNWAVDLDQVYLQEFADYRDRIVFGINQVDLVHPMDWNERINLPSARMECNIEDIIHDRAEKLRDVLGGAPQVLAFSALRRFNLEQLFDMLISAIPGSRKSAFDALKKFSYRDFIPVRSGGLPGSPGRERAQD